MFRWIRRILKLCPDRYAQEALIRQREWQESEINSYKSLLLGFGETLNSSQTIRVKGGPNKGRKLNWLLGDR